MKLYSQYKNYLSNFKDYLKYDNADDCSAKALKEGKKKLLKFTKAIFDKTPWKDDQNIEKLAASCIAKLASCTFKKKKAQKAKELSQIFHSTIQEKANRAAKEAAQRAHEEAARKKAEEAAKRAQEEASKKQAEEAARQAKEEALIKQIEEAVRQAKEVLKTRTGKVDNKRLHHRTINTLNFLEKLPNYNKAKKVIAIKGKEHLVISSEVTEFAYTKLPLIFDCGGAVDRIINKKGSVREIMILDAENSPLLQERYKEYEIFLKSYFVKNKGLPLSPIQFAAKTTHFMQYIFPPENCGDLRNKLINLNHSFATDDSIAVNGISPIYIPIDIFLQKQLAVCRHHSIVAAYFMDKYIKDHPHTLAFKSKIQIMENDTHRGRSAHAWLTLVCNDGTDLCIDTYNQSIGNLNDKNFTENFEQLYDQPHMIKNQKDKAKLLRERYKDYLKPA